jgi:hypothetical protein
MEIPTGSHAQKKHTHRKYAQENKYAWGDIYTRDKYLWKTYMRTNTHVGTNTM